MGRQLKKTVFAVFFLPVFCLPALRAQGGKAKTFTIHTDTVQIQLQFYTPGTVRVIKALNSHKAGPGKYLSIVASPHFVPVKETENNDVLIFKTDSIEVQVNKQNGVVAFTRGDRLLLREDPAVSPLFKKLPQKADAFRIQQGFVLDKEEAIYGLGQHQKGTMNQRNQEQLLQQANMEIAIPVLQSIKGYGILWNNESTTLFSDTLGQTRLLSDKGKTIDYFFISGRNPDDVVAGIRYLTGAAPMPPKWAFGYFQSRERYTSQQQVLDVVKKYRGLRVPLDGIVQDWRYWGMDFKDWNATSFGNPAYSRPQDMIDSVHLLHAHMIISVWPSFGEHTAIYKQLNSAGLLLHNINTWPQEGGVAVYNAFSDKARKIVWDHMNKNIFSKGMDGWWLDATEPIDKDNHASIQMLKHTVDTVPAVLNSYPLYTTSGIANHQLETAPSKRVFILTRSAFTGQQHYGTYIWSGDIVSSWQVMKNQLSGALNIGLCGIPYWNTDIGGFFSGQNYPKGIEDAAFRELYVRWLELGTFFPLMRSHGSNTPREIYRFGKKGDWAYDAIEKFINLRYRLLPYNYATAHQVTANAASFMRPLFADFLKDTNTYDINDAYLYGSSFLIAPVVESQYIDNAGGTHKTDFSAIKTRRLYLPAGTTWYDFWTGQTFSGGQAVSAAAPIDRIPVYVKAGSIIPLGPEMQYVDERPADTIELRIYAGADGRFTLYEDDGVSLAYTKGGYTLIDISWDDARRILTIGQRTGNDTHALTSRVFNVVLVKKGSGTGAADSRHYNQTIIYNGDQLKIGIQ